MMAALVALRSVLLRASSAGLVQLSRPYISLSHAVRPRSYGTTAALRSGFDRGGWRSAIRRQPTLRGTAGLQIKAFDNYAKGRQESDSEDDWDDDSDADERAISRPAPAQRKPNANRVRSMPNNEWDEMEDGSRVKDGRSALPYSDSDEEPEIGGDSSSSDEFDEDMKGDDGDDDSFRAYEREEAKEVVQLLAKGAKNRGYRPHGENPALFSVQGQNETVAVRHFVLEQAKSDSFVQAFLAGRIGGMQHVLEVLSHPYMYTAKAETSEKKK
ncbi:hypothetical protein FVE85_1381 [Porphyridium purpureum]|uniref:Uncharacterized protein n=1 Tax=Porphyridium purpureum TaxID=35688 RepID=A0A5J4YV46_PORPP|nr:hypothetical protein FVE85_1381 [Porphyridium purpureum]|eukprot:POR2173..scf209_3